MPKVSMTVNGKAVTADADARTLLVQYLREGLRLTGTHVGCDTSQCGACRRPRGRQGDQVLHHVRLGGGGKNVLTIEGLAQNGKLHPMQEAFRDNHGLQCGFCTPGMIMTAVDMVTRKGNSLDDKTIRENSRATSAAAPPPQHREVDRCQHEGDGVTAAEETDPKCIETIPEGGTPWARPGSAQQSTARKISGSSPARASTPTTSRDPDRPTSVRASHMRTRRSGRSTRPRPGHARRRRGAHSRRLAADGSAI